MVCQHCENKNYLVETYVCDKCEEPTPLCLIPEEGKVPVVAWLNRTGEGTSSKLNLVKARPAVEFNCPTNDEPYLEIVEDEDEEVLVWNEDIQVYAEPFDFETMFNEEPNGQVLARQVEKIRTVWPDFKSPYNTGDEVRDYGKGKGGGKPRDRSYR